MKFSSKRIYWSRGLGKPERTQEFDPIFLANKFAGKVKNWLDSSLFTQQFVVSVPAWASASVADSEFYFAINPATQDVIGKRVQDGIVTRYATNSWLLLSNREREAIAATRVVPATTDNIVEDYAQEEPDAD